MVAMAPSEHERVLTRLADEWNRCRSGRPGFFWAKARRVCEEPKVKEWLKHSYNWDPTSSGRDIYAAFLKAIEQCNAQPGTFDSWDISPDWATPSDLTQAGDARKRMASKARKATAPPLLRIWKRSGTSEGQGLAGNARNGLRPARNAKDLFSPF